MKKLQRIQAKADKRWGFDFALIDKLDDAQASLPGAGVAPLNPDADRRQRRLEYCALALAGEVGELANTVKKVRRAMLMQQPYDTFDDALQDEAADILAYLLKLSNLMEWDLESAYLSKMARNDGRFKRPPTD